MILFTCIDDRGGMQFNHRRQSQDRILREELLRRCEGRPLHMNAASAALFAPEAPILVSEDFLETAAEDDCCFAETGPLLPWADRIRKLVLFRWNRVYPADVWLDLPLENGAWRLVSSQDFPGSSHDKITVEVYEK